MAEEKEIQYGVYSKCRAEKSREKYDKKEGMYDKKHSKVLEKDCVLSLSYVEGFSPNFKSSGVYYKLDEAKTKKYREELKAKLDK